MFKLLLLTVILFLGSLSTASAQSSNGEFLGEGRVGSGRGTEGVGTEIAIGWNTVHVQNCFVDSNSVFHVFPVESAQVAELFTVNPTVIALLTPACQTGNFIAVFVPN